MAQEDCGGVAAPMGYSRQRSVDPSHYPMCRRVDGEETRTRDLSSHLGTNRAWLLSELPEEKGIAERFRALWEGPLTPEGIGRCLLSSQRGWDAVIGLATEVVDRLNSIRREEERRGSRPIEDQAV